MLIDSVGWLGRVGECGGRLCRLAWLQTWTVARSTGDEGRSGGSVRRDASASRVVQVIDPWFITLVDE